MSDLMAALSWLTVLPAPCAEGARPVRHFPTVGLLLGGLAVGMRGLVAVVVVSDVGWLLVGVLVVVLWTVVTGALHWDGLADAADGLLGGSNAEERLAIMRDSATGAFGTTAVSAVFMTQSVAVAVVAASGSWWPLLAAPVFGRLAAVVSLWTLPPARGDGLAARLAGDEGGGAWFVVVGVVGAISVMAPTPVELVVALIGAAVAVVLPRRLASRVGGATGDLAGAAVLLTETAVLVCAALAGGV